MLDIVVATRNLHKLEEIRAILAGLPVRLMSAEEAGAPDVVEDQATLEGNARKKAEVVASATGRWALADDTGLEVPALGGAPGVYSARYAGPNATYKDNCAKLLRALDGMPPAARAARFRCIMHLQSPPDPKDGESWFFAFVGMLAGEIGTEPRGAHGFGYDPIFVLAAGEDQARRTLAELTLEEKNEISHRGRALAGLRAKLPEIIALAEGEAAHVVRRQ